MCDIFKLSTSAISSLLFSAQLSADIANKRNELLLLLLQLRFEPSVTRLGKILPFGQKILLGGFFERVYLLLGDILSKILLTLGKFFQTLFSIGENFWRMWAKKISNSLVTLFEPGANPINDLQAYICKLVCACLF